jgi:hypothetical protein
MRTLTILTVLVCVLVCTALTGCRCCPIAGCHNRCPTCSETATHACPICQHD